MPLVLGTRASGRHDEILDIAGGTMPHEPQRT
jgi:hypothetical protein